MSTKFNITDNLNLSELLGGYWRAELADWVDTKNDDMT